MRSQAATPKSVSIAQATQHIEEVTGVRISAKLVRSEVERGKLPHFRFGAARRILVEDLDRYIAQARR